MGQGRVAGSVGVHSWAGEPGRPQGRAATGQGGHKGGPYTEGMTAAVAGGGGGGAFCWWKRKRPPAVAGGRPLLYRLDLVGPNASYSAVVANLIVDHLPTPPPSAARLMARMR